MQAGLEERDMVLLLTDAQIIDEAFLEDINNLLHSGDVPGLLCPEDCECAVAAMREHLEELGKPSDKVLQKSAQQCKPNSTLIRLSCSECLQVPHACLYVDIMTLEEIANLLVIDVVKIEPAAQDCPSRRAASQRL